MFDQEGFIADFVEAIKTENVEKQQEVLNRLSDSEDKDLRVDLIKGIVAKLEEAEEDYSNYVEELNKQIELLNLVEAIASKEQDSTGEEAKDAESAAEEATQDVAADTSADETEVESGGYAPAKEEKAEKDEEK